MGRANTAFQLLPSVEKQSLAEIALTLECSKVRFHIISRSAEFVSASASEFPLGQCSSRCTRRVRLLSPPHCCASSFLGGSGGGGIAYFAAQELMHSLRHLLVKTLQRNTMCGCTSSTWSGLPSGAARSTWPALSTGTSQAAALVVQLTASASEYLRGARGAAWRTRGNVTL
jgi:hypothetical protein